MKHIAWVGCLVFLAIGCSKKLTTSRVEQFDVFYDQFHSDAQFQLERVSFPLEGKYEGPEGFIEWDQQNWETHQQKVSEISDPNYDTELRRIDDVMIEKVQLRGGGYYSERRFQLIDGKWYLVYYETVNL